MIRLVDRVGQVFGRLTIIKIIAKAVIIDGQFIRNPIVEAICECGITKEYMLNHLIRESTKSCGCLRDELVSKRFYKHGHSITMTKTYTIWRNMIYKIGRA